MLRFIIQVQPILSLEVVRGVARTMRSECPPTATRLLYLKRQQNSFCLMLIKKFATSRGSHQRETMINSSDSPYRPSNSQQDGWLPVEIVSQIVEIFFDQLSAGKVSCQDWVESIAYDLLLSSSSTAELLSLRLVCKTWDMAVTPICFRAVWFHDSKGVQSIIDLMTIPEPLDISSFVIKMINLIGRNVTELHLKVSDLIMITPALVEAVRNIKDLKTLSIQGRRHYEPHGGYDPQALSDLLAAPCNLECLIFQGYNLKHSKLAPTALSKLKHIRFIDCFDSTNIESIIDIIDRTKDSVISMEMLADETDHDSYEFPNNIEPVFNGILNTLEVISCGTIMSDLSERTVETEFPRLRVICNIYASSYHEDSFVALWDIFYNVRTIVQLSDDGQNFWRSSLNRISDDPWKPPKLRLLVFTSFHGEDEELDSELVDTLKSHGVYCCYIPRIRPDEMLVS
ncbi:uncharacterized protein MELLADRAFT_64486 [Melampsora larici-populina 98AG31]|uniref:Uncharacterized protein n=1 Tax=Melampsora larici-populina (strain 98AG31 / pathotype 3-4-7) TaxID=747676 RepID=F4RRM3_MELLP|nr:uncharacterized protein MELLADRAFT_64486 [Melampsora larici-populina 98AG31]EGG04952.1 hypothetical protein MELLADRAFT_64486 [Melampsora larici-populina 98AG31]